VAAARDVAGINRELTQNLFQQSTAGRSMAGKMTDDKPMTVRSSIRSQIETSGLFLRRTGHWNIR
jgi:hypothetical protein